VESGDGLIEHGKVIGIEHRLNGKYVGVLAERLHGPENHGLAADGAVLLRSAGPGTQAASGGNENGGGTLRSGHAASRA